MKILFWTASFLPDLGGMQWSVYRLARSLSGMGHDVTILTRQANGPEIVFDCNIVRIQSADILDWTIVSGRWILKNVDNFDIIHVIDFFYKSINKQLALLENIHKPSVLKIPTAGYVNRLINSDKLKRSLSDIDAFIALNNDVRNELIDVGIKSNKVYDIPNGVELRDAINLAHKENVRRLLSLPLNKKLVLYAGRIVYRKRLDILVAAMAELDDEVALIIVGSGFGQRDSAEEKIIRLVSDSDRIFFVGAVNNCSQYFEACDLQVLVSECEGMPNSLLEGMASSLPTVGSAIPGIVDLVTDGVEGILVPVGDIKKTALAIATILNSDSLCETMGANARQKIVDSFDIDFVARRYELLYKRLMNGE